MTISIFNMRWYGIKGQTIEPGSPYEEQCIRVQTTKDGAWQALNDKELEQLLVEHNKLVAGPKERHGIPMELGPVGKMIIDHVSKHKAPPNPKEFPKAKTVHKADMKLHGKKKAKAKK